MTRPLQQVVCGGLMLWVVGVLSLEAVASIGLAAVAVATGYHLWRTRAARPLGSWKVWLPWLAFVGWALVAPAVVGRWATGTGTARLAELLAIPLVATAWRELSAMLRHRVLLVGAGVFTLSCVLAGLQHFGVWPDEPAFMAWAWTKIPFSRVYELVPGSSDRHMAGGLVFHRLKFAHVGALAVLVALAYGLRGPARGRRYALLVAALGAASILIFPYARMAAAALVASMGLVGLWGASNARAGVRLAASLCALVLVVAATQASLRERFVSALTSAGNGERGALLATGLRAVTTHPMVGTGAGRFRPARFADPDTPAQVLEHPGKSHNQFVSIAAESGLVGLALFLWALWRLGRTTSRSSAEGLIGVGGLALFFALSLTHDPLFHPQFSMAWVLCLGMSASAALTAAPAHADRPSAFAGHTTPS